MNHQVIAPDVYERLVADNVALRATLAEALQGVRAARGHCYDRGMRHAMLAYDQTLLRARELLGEEATAEVDA